MAIIDQYIANLSNLFWYEHF